MFYDNFTSFCLYMNLAIWANYGRFLVWSLVIFMAMIGMVVPIASPGLQHKLYELVYPGYVGQLDILAQSPFADNAHRVLGSCLLIIGGLQFEGRLRKAAPRLHRLAGRLYLALGVSVAALSMILSFRHGFAGEWENVFTVVTVIGFVVMLALAWYYAVRLKFNLHREWMIRSFALVLYVAVLRIYTTVLTLFFELTPQDVFLVSWFLAVVTNLAVAEWWIRQSRRLAMAKL